jgi:hypothetical protein
MTRDLSVLGAHCPEGPMQIHQCRHVGNQALKECLTMPLLLEIGPFCWLLRRLGLVLMTLNDDNLTRKVQRQVRLGSADRAYITSITA